MKYNITPIAKPRMTRADQWRKRKCVMQYWAFKDQCKAKHLSFPPRGARIAFGLPMPASWSAKKRDLLDGNPHQSKPDLDNLLKGLADAVYEDDSVISSYAGIEKVWAREGFIEIE